MAWQQNVDFPGWEVVRRIGSGSFGTVYEIQRDIYGDVEKAALKVITIPHSEEEVEYMRVSGLDDRSISGALQRQVGDIAKEYKLMAQMRENPNVVRCDDFRDVVQADGLGWDIYIKMELLTPLLKKLEAVQAESQIIQLGKDICNALIACQERNIIHRDIKPQNIFISDNGKFKLGDFGIARRMEKTTHATVGIGTYAYMAPEVAKNEPYGKTADIYSLGLLLYWLLNARRGPFMPLPPEIPKPGDEDMARQRRFFGEQIPAPLYGSKALKTVVLKACAYDPLARYEDAAQMLEALNGISAAAAPVVVQEDLTVAVRPAPSSEVPVPPVPTKPAPEKAPVVTDLDRTVAVRHAAIQIDATVAQPQKKICPSCGASIALHAKFCPRCGNAGAVMPTPVGEKENTATVGPNWKAAVRAKVEAPVSENSLGPVWANVAGKKMAAAPGTTRPGTRRKLRQQVDKKAEADRQWQEFEIAQQRKRTGRKWALIIAILLVLGGAAAWLVSILIPKKVTVTVLAKQIYSDRVVSYEYDEYGSVIETVTEYTDLGKSPEILTNAYQYDDKGNVTEENMAGAVTSYTYDDNGNVLTKTIVDSYYEYTYDKDGRLTQVVEPVGKYTYEYYGDYYTRTLYNEDGELCWTETYTKQANGAVTMEKRDAEGNKISSASYCSLGNLHEEVYYNGSVTNRYEYIYDEDENLVEYRNTYDGDLVQRTQYYYDSEGQLYAIVTHDGVRIDLKYKEIEIRANRADKIKEQQTELLYGRLFDYEKVQILD